MSGHRPSTLGELIVEWVGGWVGGWADGLNRLIDLMVLDGQMDRDEGGRKDGSIRHFWIQPLRDCCDEHSKDARSGSHI